MAKVINMFTREAIENSTKKAASAAEIVAKNTIRKTARDSAEVFYKNQGNVLIDAIEKTAKVDRQAAKSIMRQERKMAKQSKNVVSDTVEKVAGSSKETVSDAYRMKNVQDNIAKAKKDLEVKAENILKGRTFNFKNDGEIVQHLVNEGMDLENITDSDINAIKKRMRYDTEMHDMRKEKIIEKLRGERTYERTQIPESQKDIDGKNKIGARKDEPRLSGSQPKPQSNEKQFSTGKLKGKMYDSKDDYMRYAAARDYDDAISSFGKGEFNNPILKKLEKEGVDLKGLSKTDLKAYRDEAILNASGKDMQLMDTLGYYQVPQKATAAAGTMWLVNKLASSNGQQTNAQLYGQQSY